MKNKINEYKIVTETSQLSLSETVNDCISDGWQPIGGISATIDERDYRYYHQAIVRYD